MRRVDHFHRNKDIIGLLKYVDKLRKQNKKNKKRIIDLRRSEYMYDVLEEIKELYKCIVITRKEIHYGDCILLHFF